MAGVTRRGPCCTMYESADATMYESRIVSTISAILSRRAGIVKCVGHPKSFIVELVQKLASGLHEPQLVGRGWHAGHSMR
ncbi:MAG: hypothetical protein NTX53_06885 [candidate division WOR-3 bacterium]|nr:hypothetical protein [candidate division WOR-3 bacterium]